MQQTLQTVIQICLLKARAQDLPASMNALLMSALAMFVGHMITDSIRTSDANVLATSLLNVVLLGITLRLLVMLFKKPERWLQFTIAIMGCNALIMLIVAPFISMAISGDSTIMSIARLIILAAMIWSVIIRVRILAETLEVTFGVAVVVAVAMELAIYLTLFKIFGEQIL